MKNTIILVLTLFSVFVIADDEIPVWEYPILGSEYIGDNCSEETNSIMMKILFSQEGEIMNIDFLKKSTIEAVNEEAKNYMMEESPFMEFDDMTQEEKKKFGVVHMSYSIPCTNS